MTFKLSATLAASALLVAISSGGAAFAQKHGGILRMYTPDSPASMSIHEEATVFAQGPMMGVFNNLVMFDQHVKQNSLEAIVPDLATGWSWNEEGTELTFPLRQGVKWHDGKPFTANDVKCTWDLLIEQSSEKFRVNPRRTSYKNLEQITTNGDYEVTFHLKRPQAGFRQSIPATSRRAKCVNTRLAPARLNSANSNPTSASPWSATRIIGDRGCHIWTASNIRSSAIRLRRRWPSRPGSST